MHALDYDVVIPSHGRNMDFLLRAVRSVQSQTIPARSIIVVVDGNLAAAEELRRADSTITVIGMESQRGQAAARQVGIGASSAGWIAFLDDDDLWSVRKQERMARYLGDHPDCRAVRAGFWVFADPNTKHDGINGQLVELRGRSLSELESHADAAVPLNDLSYLDIEGRSLDLMLEFNRGVISTTMVRRETLESIAPVPEGLRPGDDYLLFCNVAATTEWHLVRERLAFYRIHGGQDTRRRDPAQPLGIIAAKTWAWKTNGSLAPRALESYGPVYRRELRYLLWGPLRQLRFDEAISLYRAGSVLLPRRRDRAAALVPEPLVWHAGRIVRKVLRVREAVQSRPPW